MNLIQCFFFIGTAVVSLCFALYLRWVFLKYTLPSHRTAVTGCEVARYVLDQRGFLHVSVTPLEPSGEYPSMEGFFLDPKIYEGRDFLALIQAARLAFLKSQFSNMTFWVRLKNRMALVVRIAVFSGWALFLLGVFFRPLNFFINMGLGCFTVVMVLAVFDLPFELEVEERTSEFLRGSGHFQQNEYVHIKKLNQAIAFQGLASIVRVPFGACCNFFRKKETADGF
ncbi:MAG TPA: zinc metallopeptidase [Candidatus Omnitrophota bacterium]|nr:zinc metallopeptidase [Candidatus Omnitrophota bacterium]HPS37469.1 zinc metallopeptidase [Candidatus Omnitrophota bacterium]